MEFKKCKTKRIKKVLVFSLILSLVLAGIGGFAGASGVFFPVMTAKAAPGDIPIDEEHFPDANFRAYLQSASLGTISGIGGTTAQQYKNYGSDGVFTQAELDDVNWMECENKNISDFTGIELFSNIGILHCKGNHITTLNLQNCPRLYELDCSGNDLTTLTFENCPSLDYIDCQNNEITALNMNGCTTLKTLYAQNNLLTVLDVGGCSNLEKLNCSNNQLSALNVNDCPKVTRYYPPPAYYGGTTYVDCSYNPLTELKVNHGNYSGGKSTVSNGGIGTFNAYRVDKTKLTLADPVSDNPAYTFKEWRISNDETTQEATTFSSANATLFTVGPNDVTITAIWKNVSTGEEYDPSGSTPADPLDYDLTVVSPVKMQWQGVSGDNITKAIGNVAVSGSSKKLGRLTKSTTVTVDPTRIPAGRSIKVSVPVKNITITVNGEALAATVTFADVTLTNADGVKTYTATITTDRSDLPFDDYFDNSVSGTAVVHVDEL